MVHVMYSAQPQTNTEEIETRRVSDTYVVVWELKLYYFYPSAGGLKQKKELKKEEASMITGVKLHHSIRYSRHKGTADCREVPRYCLTLSSMIRLLEQELFTK